MRGSGRGWAFIDLADLGRNSARGYAAVAARIVVYPLAVATLLGLLVAAATLIGRPPDWLDPLVGIVTRYGLIIVAGAAVLRGVVRSHRRPWRSLIGADSRIDMRRLAIGAAVELLILGGQLALVHAMTGWPWRFVLPDALPLVLFALALLPLQAASEEILFRGYLTQALGRLVRSRGVIALVVGLAFGALHLNAYGPLTVPYFLVLSLVFSLVSLRDGRLELAIGGHAAMNFFAVATAGFSPLAPAIIGLDRGAIAFNWAAIVVLVVNGALFYAMTRLLVLLVCERRAAPCS